jgi:hypothetical protein
MSSADRKPLTPLCIITLTFRAFIMIGVSFGAGYLVAAKPKPALQESTMEASKETGPIERPGTSPAVPVPADIPSTRTRKAQLSNLTQEPLRSFELPSTSNYSLIYTGMGAGKIPSMLRTAAKYRLWVPMTLTTTPNVSAGAEANSLEPLLQEAFREVEAVFGPFARQVEVYVVDEIPHRTNANKCCLGIAWWEAGKPHMAVRARPFSRDTVAVHELVHLRIEERGYKIPTWLEEGFCHFYQAADGRSESCLPQFENFPQIPSYAGLAQAEADDWSARAMGWALVHYWIKQEKRSLENALALGAGPVTAWPSPEVVLAYARGFRRGLAERDLASRP